MGILPMFGLGVVIAFVLVTPTAGTSDEEQLTNMVNALKAGVENFDGLRDRLTEMLNEEPPKAAEDDKGHKKSDQEETIRPTEKTDGDLKNADDPMSGSTEGGPGLSAATDQPKPSTETPIGSKETAFKEGGFNPGFVLESLSGLLENTNVFSPKALEMVKKFAESFVKSKQFETWMLSTTTFVKEFSESPNGKKIVALLPALAKTNDVGEFLEILRKGTTEMWQDFFHQLKNSDFKEAFLLGLSGALNNGYGYLFKDELKMLMANAFLISQGLPVIRPNNVLMSLLDLIEESVNTFTTFRPDMETSRETVKQAVKLLELEYASAKDFQRMEKAERERLIARFLDDNVASVAQELWSINAGLALLPKVTLGCVQNVICTLNANAVAKDNIFRQTVIKYLSIAAASYFSSNFKLDLWEINEAVHSGHQPGVACDSLYKTGSECEYFKGRGDEMKVKDSRQEL